MSAAERTEDGFVVDATLIAEAFHLPAAEVPGLMRAGRITVRSETGVGEDEGNTRLTFYYGNRAFRMTIDPSGAVGRRGTFPTRPR